MKFLRTMTVVGGVYDLLLALPLLVAPVALAAAFGAPRPDPVVNAQLNGLFTLTLAMGYFWALGDLAARRGYLWLAGVMVKALGALLFVGDHVFRGSPTTFLLFAASDSTIALLTAIALVRTR